MLMTMNLMIIHSAHRRFSPSKVTSFHLIVKTSPGAHVLKGISKDYVPFFARLKILLIVILFIFCSASKAQELISIKNGETFNPEKVENFLLSLQSQNDYVISFRVKLTDTVNEKSDYFVMLMKDKTLVAFRYLAESENLQPLNLPIESLDLVWNTFIQNDLFGIQNESDIPIFCLEKYHVYNSYSYEFVILSKDKMKKLSYYDPEYYDNACYGMIERKKVINSVAVINHVLSH